MRMEPVVAAFLVALAGAVTPVVQFATQRRMGLTPAHDRLISLLQQTIEVQGKRLVILEEEQTHLRKENAELRIEVKELRDTVSAQAVELARRARSRTNGSN